MIICVMIVLAGVKAGEGLMAALKGRDIPAQGDAASVTSFRH
jgi:hypothetical protein